MPPELGRLRKQSLRNDACGAGGGGRRVGGGWADLGAQVLSVIIGTTATGFPR